MKQHFLSLIFALIYYTDSSKSSQNAFNDKINCPFKSDATTLLSDLSLQRLTPPRPLHSNGGGAYGQFEVTNDVTRYTSVSTFAYVGKVTNVLVRFSTNWGEAGSSDIPLLAPDVRGFAIRFYTDVGNWDLVGGNRPVSPIRDPHLFGELAASRTRHKESNTFDADAWFNFTASYPQTTMQLVQLFSDHAYPASWRYMDGALPHTIKLVNAQFEAVYCRFEMIAGANGETENFQKYFTFEEAANISKMDGDFAKKDLFQAIAAQKFPFWTIYLQIMTFDQAQESTFDPFDPTKIWPTTLYPLVEVGRLTLNKNPSNYHSEIELAAFEPGLITAGMGPSLDKIFEARISAYPLIQRQRLGVNYHLLPVNSEQGLVNQGSIERPGKTHPIYTKDVQWTGEVDDYAQAKDFYERLSSDEQNRLAGNVGRFLKLASRDVQKRMLDNLRNVGGQKMVDGIKNYF